LASHLLNARQRLRSSLFEAARASSPDYSPEGIEAHLFLVGLFNFSLVASWMQT